MKDELQSKLVEILTAIQTAAGKASDFALEQLPDIAQQYVAYGRVWLTVQLVLAVVMFIMAVGLSAWTIRRAMRSNDPGGEMAAYVIPVNLFLLGPGAFALGAWSLHAISGASLVWFAPKVWLLKELAALIP